MHPLILLGDVARPPIARMRGHVARTRERRRDERGFVLVFALLIMVSVILVMVAISAGALRENNQSANETAADQASAAADAGAQVALYRLNETGGSTGETGTIGNGASYTYAVTTLANSSSPCAGLWVQSTSQSLEQDCITSTGTVEGVSQRVQERVVSYTPSVSLFPVNGLFAVSGFSAAGAVGGTFNLGSNGKMTFTNQVNDVGQLEYPSGTPPSYAGSSCTGNCVPVAESSPIAVPTIPTSAWTSAESSNNDAAISWPAGFTYTASTHTVTESGVNNATVNFPAGTYYYCGIDLGGGTTATINTTSWPVKIYIDSTTGGRCTTGTGSLTGSNAVTVANSSGVASHVQLYFYGNPPCTTSCASTFAVNSQNYDGDVFAPYSSMTVAGGGTFTGDAVIGDVTANGALTFTYQAPATGDYGSTTASFYPAGHASCLPPSTTGGTGGTC